MARELELKLRCREQIDLQAVIQCCEDLGATFAYKDQALTDSKNLRNIYFDTDSLLLHKQCMALRLRNKAGLYIQTLKTSGTSIDGISQRGEWEWPLDQNELDVSLLNEAPVWSAQLRDQEYQAVFETNFSREACEFDYQGYAFELVLDVGEIVSQARSNKVPINEIEIELKASHSAEPTNIGAEKAVSVLQSLSHALCEILPLEQYDVSKAERGYALFLG